MAVAVNIPIRIKVDSDALWRRPRCIDSALSKAVGRALTKSSDIVLDARGGYPAVQIHPPEIRWSGTGLGRVPQGVRAETEALVSSVLARAIAAAAIVTPAGELSEVPPPLPDNASEKIDPERHAPLLGRYLIPSYDGTGRKVAVKAGSTKGKVGTTEAAQNVAVPIFKRIDPNWQAADCVLQFYEAALAYLSDHGEFVLKGPQVMGLIGSSGSGYQILFFRVADAGQIATDYDLDRDVYAPNVTFLLAGPPFVPTKFTLVKGKDGLEFSTAPNWLTPETPSYLLRWVPANGPADRLATVDRQLRDRVVSALKAEREKLAADITDAEFATWAEKIAADQISRVKSDPTIKSFFSFERVGVGPSDLEVPSQIGTDIMNILPLTGVRWDSKEAKLPGLAAPRARARASRGAGADSIAARARRNAGADSAAAKARGPSSTGTFPIGPAGIQGQSSPWGGDENVPPVDCSEQYETRYSSLYPEQYLEDTDHLKCRPLLGEPALERLGEHAKPLQATIEYLTAELGLVTCGAYAGSFCLGAAQAIAARARRIGEQAATEGAGTAGVLETSDQGNLGFVQFDPQSTPAIQELHRLAGLLDQVMELGDRMQGLYRWYWQNLCGRWYKNSGQWGHAFHVLFHPIKNDAVGNLFKSTCRVLLLQLLEASRSQIKARKKNLATYAPMFEFLLRAYFTQKGDLETLKARLQMGTMLLGGGGSPAGSWLALSSSLLEEFDKGNAPQPGTVTVKDDLVYNADQKIVGIQDENGNVWTKASLEQALTQREYLVESIDPMIKQFSDDEASFILGLLNKNPTFEVKFKFQAGAGAVPKLGDIEKAILKRVVGAQKISAEVVVGAILDEMLAKNADQERKTRQSFGYAFEMAPLHANTKASRIPFCGFALQGIHKLADEQIGGAFRMHQSRYGWELDKVLAARAGAESLTSFFKAVGVAVLSIVCPPLGVAAGAAMAIGDYEKALEKKALFRSLIDPDLVITRAEVEAELFAAELGLVLTFLPHAKTVLGGVAKGIQVVSKEGVRGSARAVVTQARRALTLDGAQAAAAALRQRFARQVAEGIKDDFAVAIAHELISDQLMDVFLGKLLIEPLVNSIYDDFKGYSSDARGPGIVTKTFGQGGQ